MRKIKITIYKISELTPLDQVQAHTNYLMDCEKEIFEDCSNYETLEGFKNLCEELGFEFLEDGTLFNLP